MINRKQFKLSTTLGIIILIIQLLIGINPHTGMYQQFHPIFELFGTELWYIPLIYLFLRFFVISATIYLIFRIINYLVIYIRNK